MVDTDNDTPPECLAKPQIKHRGRVNGTHRERRAQLGGEGPVVRAAGSDDDVDRVETED